MSDERTAIRNAKGIFMVVVGGWGERGGRDGRRGLKLLELACVRLQNSDLVIMT